jgi:hypothetical protein
LELVSCNEAPISKTKYIEIGKPNYPACEVKRNNPA